LLIDTVTVDGIFEELVEVVTVDELLEVLVKLLMVEDVDDEVSVDLRRV
jgi:hypothetical protein